MSGGGGGGGGLYWAITCFGWRMGGANGMWCPVAARQATANYLHVTRQEARIWYSHAIERVTTARCYGDVGACERAAGASRGRFRFRMGKASCASLAGTRQVRWRWLWCSTVGGGQWVYGVLLARRCNGREMGGECGMRRIFLWLRGVLGATFVDLIYLRLLRTTSQHPHTRVRAGQWSFLEHDVLLSVVSLVLVHSLPLHNTSYMCIRDVDSRRYKAHPVTTSSP